MKDRPQYIPVGIFTVLFAQYFGSSVMQSIGGAIFQNRLVKQLEARANLDSDQVAILVNAGSLKVRDMARQDFLDRLDAVIAAYKDAVTNVFKCERIDTPYLADNDEGEVHASKV
ncbi:hypothetical protein BO70DRAFT_393143 [Aspergillus heteromorphus CBS 117.55]|uniref:Uncharacterized protein n=1 Tax=Aspergillus heteromorphus CBS 117.55 TaxID=1448321 RepID=A0A317WVT3_9EURO|nr:uncharacterized protein BO70DRAFT_393143 [Aspergillus heteromorphus CBS 117.55]PWY89951.1 hypothetical protein BO70DRAFT_393143 [Aspergillus heteromorphus CBS 117.55]